MTALGHNGGPPLEDEHVPEWGRGGAGRYFAWKRAHAAAWKSVSWDTMMRRQRKAEAVGLTYEEYTLELLERGRYLGPDDAERIEAIKRARPAPTLVGAAPAPPRNEERPAPAAHRRRVLR
jgi:hypothetical protein